MQYKPKQLKRLYNDPIKNFSKILDAYIYFKEIDDIESFEIIYVLFNMNLKVILDLLNIDLLTRSEEDYNTTGYKHIWWILTHDAECVQCLCYNKLKQPIQDLFNYWINNLVNKHDSFYVKISKILNYHK